ncbi:NACHT domain-containing protein [Scytonema tolypothrichoides VB-61278]|nr:NACHT domain-containing protein [Scytonema tolypothrichoides VB-61278]
MSHYTLDQLRESMVKILNPNSPKGEIAGSGFIIRGDGYLVTCHHVIYLLDLLKVEYRGEIYEAQWCEELSNPEIDIAILKINITNAKAVPIINPQQLSISVTVYGFPPAKKTNFPEGFAVSAQSISRSAPLNTVSTYRTQEIKFTQPWNQLPQKTSTFLSHRIDAKVEPGTSGGAVFAEELGGVVGVIQCSKSDESFVIRWDNITTQLDQLGLEPEKNAVCQFLQEIEDYFKYIKLFHTQQPILLKEQYIPIQVSLETKRKDVENFWEYGESEAELKRAYALKRMGEESQRTQVDWEEAKKQNQKIMVLADPGMGKSTLLRMEAGLTAQAQRQRLLDRTHAKPLVQAEGVKPHPSPSEPHPALRASLTPGATTGGTPATHWLSLLRRGKDFSAAKSEGEVLSEMCVDRSLQGEGVIDDVIFPLFIRLSDLDEQATEVIDTIRLIIQRDYPKTAPLVKHLLEEKLKNGKCLLLLDALDEVPKEHRNDLKDKLNRFTRNSSCPIICTSRIVGYGGAFVESAKEVEIVPFSQKQTEEYIETWFTNAAGYIEDDSVSAGKLIEELRHKPQITGLAQNPLLLSLLCSLYQEKGLTLPARRTQVYEKAVDYMLSKWRSDNHRQSSSDGWVIAKIQLLESLAYQFSCEGKEIFSLRELREKIENFLRGESCSDFRNATAANLMKELCEEDGIIQKLARQGEQYLFLHRTFQEYLTASYLKNASNGIALAREHFWEYDWHETLTLLAGLMENPIPLLEAITKEKDDIFKTLLLLAGRAAAECKQNNHPLIAKIIDSIYQFWQFYPSASFITSTVVTLGQVSSQMCQKLQEALNHSDLWVRSSAAFALGKIGNSQAVDGLIAALNDSDSFVRSKAAQALGEIGNFQAVNALIAASNDSDSYVRWNAAYALCKIGSSQVVDDLITVLNRSDSDVKWKVVEALCKIGSSQVVDDLITALNHSDSDVRRKAAYTLGKSDSSQAVDALIAALNHSDSDVGWKVAEALGKIDNSQAVDALIAALNHSNSEVRRYAVYVLGKIDNSQAVDALIAALNHSDSDVRRYAAEALGEIGSFQAVDALIAALNHSDWYVKCKAAEALGEIGNPETLAKLIQFREINIYDNDIFISARTLAVRFSKQAPLSKRGKLLIPVYPELVKFIPIWAFVKRHSKWIDVFKSLRA